MSRCQHCYGPLPRHRNAKRRYCSDTCRTLASRRRRTIACHQRKVREREMAADPRPVMTSLGGCTVERIAEAEARPIILRYEWLGTTGAPSLCCGLRDPEGELIGVALFGHVGGPEAARVLTVECSHLTLVRGACVHWAHPHAASFLISRAVKLAGVDVVSAYADPAAGEIGTVYQACNWLYLGQGLGRGSNALVPRLEQWRAPDGRVVSARGLRHLGLTVKDVRALGWRGLYSYPKHRYCWLRDRRLREHLRWEPKPYPKR